MANYSVATVAKLLQVNGDAIKKWSNKFAGFLSKDAKPGKGKTRFFTLDDIRTLAFIARCWEEEPNVDNIQSELDSNSHYQDERINMLIDTLTPIFRDIPENIEELSNIGAIIDGLSTQADTFLIADSFKTAGDALIDSAIQNQEIWKLVNPALYCYRHSIELYLKAIINFDQKSHNLDKLLKKFQAIMKSEFNVSKLPEWFDDIILTMHKFDPGSTFFRYGETKHAEEIFINFSHLKMKMEWLAKGLHEVKYRRQL